jgi:hypothetical protein
MAQAKSPKNQVAKATASTAVASVPTDDFAEFAGAGMENVTANDLLVPRLSIIQALSPQLQRKKPEYIEGAEIGDIVDVGTGELFKDGIMFLPVYYRKDYLEWAPRSSGQGLVNIHTDPSILDHCERNERNQPVLPNGNYVAETAQFFGMNLTADGRKSFIPMASTQLKKARKWLTLATGEKLKRADGSTFMAPIFYRTYLLSTAEESNNEGSWSGWKIDRGPALPELGAEPYSMDWKAIKEDAVAFRESLIKGESRADVSQMAESGYSDGEEAM